MPALLLYMREAEQLEMRNEEMNEWSDNEEIGLKGGMMCLA